MRSIHHISVLQTILDCSTIEWKQLYSIFAAVLIAFIIIFTVAYASPEIIHNAAHDIRHGMTFPCH